MPQEGLFPIYFIFLHFSVFLLTSQEGGQNIPGIFLAVHTKSVIVLYDYHIIRTHGLLRYSVLVQDLPVGYS